MNDSIYSNAYALSTAEDEYMLRQAVETLLWSTPADYDTGEMLDADHDYDDMHPDALATLRAELQAFADPDGTNADDLANSGMTLGQLAHDFILTRNGHGTGFWDRGYDGLIGNRLTAACQPYGDTSAYVGDDGKIHLP